MELRSFSINDLNILYIVSKVQFYKQMVHSVTVDIKLGPTEWWWGELDIDIFCNNKIPKLKCYFLFYNYLFLFSLDGGMSFSLIYWQRISYCYISRVYF